MCCVGSDEEMALGLDIEKAFFVEKPSSVDEVFFGVFVVSAVVGPRNGDYLV